MAAQKAAGLMARGGQPFQATGSKPDPVEERDEPRELTLAEVGMRFEQLPSRVHCYCSFQKSFVRFHPFIQNRLDHAGCCPMVSYCRLGEKCL